LASGLSGLRPGPRFESRSCYRHNPRPVQRFPPPLAFIWSASPASARLWSPMRLSLPHLGPEWWLLRQRGAESASRSGAPAAGGRGASSTTRHRGDGKASLEVTHAAIIRQPSSRRAAQALAGRIHAGRGSAGYVLHHRLHLNSVISSRSMAHHDAFVSRLGAFTVVLGHLSPSHPVPFSAVVAESWS